MYWHTLDNSWEGLTLASWIRQLLTQQRINRWKICRLLNKSFFICPRRCSWRCSDYHQRCFSSSPSSRAATEKTRWKQLKIRQISLLFQVHVQPPLLFHGSVEHPRDRISLVVKAAFPVILPRLTSVLSTINHRIQAAQGGHIMLRNGFHFPNILCNAYCSIKNLDRNIYNPEFLLFIDPHVVAFHKFLQIVQWNYWGKWTYNKTRKLLFLYPT